jgi:phosphoglycolate phosphatase-like HAD superfamily hydrolase
VLLLFDIDGTLLSGASKAHAEALLAALGDVYGVAGASSAGVEAAGRTDLEIARLILLRRGMSADRIDAGLMDLQLATSEQFARLCPPSLAENLIPGVAPLLRSLAARPGVVLSLVTGNLEPVARLKLRRAGIGELFARGQGGFGSDSEDRCDLPEIARRRAADGGSTPYPRERTLVIGDTPRDIACARADAVRCLAVATGPYPAAELADADGVAEDAQALRRLIAAELQRAEPAGA